MSCSKTRKLLLTVGVEINNPVTQRILALKKEGLSDGEISNSLKISRNAVNAHLPYKKGAYTKYTNDEKTLILGGEIPKNRTKNAVNILRSRLKSNNPLRVRHNTALQQIRIKRNLTQKELSEKSGLSLSTIQAFERESRDINKSRINIIDCLCKVLNCKRNEILQFGEEKIENGIRTED